MCMCVCSFRDQIWVSHEQGLAVGSLGCSQALEEQKQKEDTRFLGAEEVSGCSGGEHVCLNRGNCS